MTDSVHFMRRWFKDDPEALDFAQHVWTAAQSWDDLRDGDLAGASNEAEDLLAWLGFGMAFHPYFQKHDVIVRPVMLSMFLSWQAANELERSGDMDDALKAYMLRAGFYQLLHIMAWIAGGTEWARDAGAEIFRFYGEAPDDVIREIEERRANHA